MSETEKKFWPCDHIKNNHPPDQLYTQPDCWWFKTSKGALYPANDWIICPSCLAERSEERDDDFKPCKHLLERSAYSIFSRHPLDPRKWKKGDCAICQDEEFYPDGVPRLQVKEEKPKKPEKLNDVIYYASSNWGMPLSGGNCRTIAEAAIEAVERVIDNTSGYDIGTNNPKIISADWIKKQIRSELL